MTRKEWKYAGFYPRLLAHNIDLMLLLPLLYLSTFLMKNTRYDLIVFSGIYILYNVLFELSKWHATPGKKWIKIVVYNEENGVLPHQSFIRNVTKIFSLLLFFGGFVWILFNTKRKALHDYPAGTVVLFKEE